MSLTSGKDLVPHGSGAENELGGFEWKTFKIQRGIQEGLCSWT